jgi:glutamate dehydrogenase (NAD(P)+)
LLITILISHLGISINKKDYTERELQSIVRRFTLELTKKNFIGAAIDVPGIDAGSNQQIMTWMMDTYQNIRGQEDINSEA